MQWDKHRQLERRNKDGINRVELARKDAGKFVPKRTSITNTFRSNGPGINASAASSTTQRKVKVTLPKMPWDNE